MRKILKNRKGVTLIELLAVIVILGIIAAIAVPTIGGLIDRQEEKAAEASFEAIKAAAVSYAEDSQAIFQLSVLESEDFIDLKDNDFSFSIAEGYVLKTSAEIYIKVVSGVVTFYSDALGATPVTLYINEYQVFPTA